MRVYKTVACTLSSERGVALLLTLLIVSILTIVVVEGFNSAYVNISLAGNFRNRLKADYITRAGVEAAKALLMEDPDTSYDALTESWANTNIPFPVGDGFVQIAINDEGGKININKLINSNNAPDQKMLKIIKRLFELKEIDTAIVWNIVDWIDSDDSIEYVAWNDNGDGAESDYYEILDKPYSCKNRRFNTLRELLWVKGITKEVYKKIEPYITVTSNGKININTAHADVLGSLSDYMSENPDIAKEIVKNRKDTPFKKNEDLDDISGIDFANRSEFNPEIDTKSSYFTIISNGIVDDVRQSERAIVKRTSTSGIKVVYWWPE